MMNNRFRFATVLMVLALFGGACQPTTRQSSTPAGSREIPHLVKKGDTTQLIVDGEPYVMLGGELHNSSSSSLEFMAPNWEKLVALNMNTILVALSWETIEPEEGVFDFTLLDGIITQAREHDMRLGLLWFGSWKNAASTYPPAWVKTDLARFPRSQDAEGNNLEHLSLFSENNVAADAAAYAAVMGHIREVDSIERTVLIMQVQNESGLLGLSRDQSAAADAAFAGQVPAELMSFLEAHRSELPDEFRDIWGHDSSRSSGTWQEVFGADADEVFMTWYNARYIDAVAEAGKAQYPLPAFVNAYQDGGSYPNPGDYPSGGPIAKMIPVWQAAAPSIDILAPDIYLPDFKGVCDKYVVMGNPMFIPEAAASEANVFYPIAELDAICYAPFGVDGARMTADHPLGDSYKLLADLMPFIIDAHGTDRMIGLLGNRGETREVDLGAYHLVISYQGIRERSGGANAAGMPVYSAQEGRDRPGYGLIIALSDEEFLAVGKGYTVQFFSKDPARPRTALLRTYEMVCENGEWMERRWLNGDDIAFAPVELFAGLRLVRDYPIVQKATVHSHE